MISSVFRSLTNKKENNNQEISFYPTRVLMQDFTGVPAVADLAAMRNALKKRGFEPKIINPLSRVDLVIDHSVMVDSYKNKNALKNMFQMQNVLIAAKMMIVQKLQDIQPLTKTFIRTDSGFEVTNPDFLMGEANTVNAQERS